MKPIFKKSYFYFWITALLIFIFRTFSLRNEVDDIINVEDTYYVIAHNDLTILVCGFLIVLGVIYFLLDVSKVKLNIKLVITHLCITLLNLITYPLVEIYYRSRENKFPLFDTNYLNNYT